METILVGSRRNGNKILTPLPKVNKNFKNPSVDWKKTVGMSVDVLYGEKTYYGINIVGYGTKIKGYIDVEYNGKFMSICPGNFKTCQLGELLGEVTKEYRYNVGDIIETNNSELKVVEQIKIPLKRKNRPEGCEKGYILECTRCKYPDGSYYRYEVLESNVKANKGCPICAERTVVEGINDIATVRPSVVQWFKNKEDAKKISLQSNNKITFKCVHCGFERDIYVTNFYKRGFICPVCSDGTSYPEKLISNILKQINVDFVYQYSPKYLHKNDNGERSFRKSDFFINSVNLVIEADGEMGHEGGIIHGYSKVSLEECIAIDKWKEEQHLLHGIKTIRINCFESNMEYIRENILKSELVNYFDFSSVDWDEADKRTADSLKIEACKIKRENPNMSVLELSRILNRSDTCIRRYLKFGHKHGWCYYNPGKKQQKC